MLVDVIMLILGVDAVTARRKRTLKLVHEQKKKLESLLASYSLTLSSLRQRALLLYNQKIIEKTNSVIELESMLAQFHVKQMKQDQESLKKFKEDILFKYNVRRKKFCFSITPNYLELEEFPENAWKLSVKLLLIQFLKLMRAYNHFERPSISRVFKFFRALYEYVMVDRHKLEPDAATIHSQNYALAIMICMLVGSYPSDNNEEAWLTKIQNLTDNPTFATKAIKIYLTNVGLKNMVQLLNMAADAQA